MFLNVHRRNHDSGFLRIHTLELQSEHPKTRQEVRATCLAAAAGKNEIELTEREDGFTLSYSESQPAPATMNIDTLEITDLPEGTLLYSINWQVWRVFSPVSVRVAIFSYELSSDKLLTNAVSKDLADIASCILSLEFQR